jgi:transposase
VDEERREAVIRRVLAGQLAVDDAALVLGISERSIWRLRARFVGAGRAGLVHGNRGRAPANRIEPALARRVVALATGRYAGMNDSHLAELLQEREHIRLSRKSVQRILRAAGIQSPRRHPRADPGGAAAASRRDVALAQGLQGLAPRRGPAHTRCLSGTIRLTGSVTDLLTESLTYNSIRTRRAYSSYAAPKRWRRSRSSVRARR